MKILVTGSRGRYSLDDREQLWNAIQDAADERLALLSDVTIIHGACKNSPDAIAAELAATYGLREDPHPANWDRHGKGAGFIRNHDMIDLKPDLVLAQWDGLSNGTLHCITHAVKAGIPVRILPPQKRETP